MSNVRRVYVEKKEGFNIEANKMLADLKKNLNINSINGLRLVNCYDVSGMNEEEFQLCKNTVFSEPPVDNLYEEKLNYSELDFIFGVKYLPGQYDQRADSAMQCIQIVTKSDNTLVETSKFIIIKGNLSTQEKEIIKGYCINPVDSMECGLEKPSRLGLISDEPQNIKSLEDFIDKSDEEIKHTRNQMGLAMSDSDLIFCRNYFRDTEKRNPTITEIKVIDTYWSDHCRHTTFLTSIENITIEDGIYKHIIEKAYNLYIEERKNVYSSRSAEHERDITLMDIAVMGAKALKKKGLLNDLDESEEINACSIVSDVDVNGTKEKWLIMFKNETHNHPTEIEPFGGAATCLGGAIRDPLSGRSYVYQAMRVTGSGNVLTPIKDTISGKLPQRKISQGAAAGYSSYGNQIGLATGLVNEIYDDGYVAKRMEIGAVIGAVKKENVVRERPVKGDIVILTGGRTGRDGCGGATGSSKEHDEESILTCGAEVQKGNAPTERKLQRLFRNPKVSKLIKRCNDFGAGGVSVAIGELADGLEINLDKVPKKYDGLDGTELAISESQERMAVVVSASDADNFIKYTNEENLEAVVVATVTDDRRLKMFWRDKDIVNISRDFLDTNGAKQFADIIVETDNKVDSKTTEITDLNSQWLSNLAQLNVASQKGLVENFDATIGASTVFMPFGGKYQLTPTEVMAAKIPVGVGNDTTTVSLMSYGYNPTIAKVSPFHSAVMAVIESVSKIVAAGGNYENIKLTFQEYFERLGNDPKKWGKPFSALLGAFYAQMRLGIAAIGGKDSMSGTFKDLTVPPTLVSFAVGLSDIETVISNEFKKTGSIIVELTTNYNKNDFPCFNTLQKNFLVINKLIKDKKIISANTIGFGGVAATLSKMSFGNKLGFTINYKDTSQLFSEKYGSFILELDCEEKDIKELFEGQEYSILGTVGGTDFTINNNKILIDDCINTWLGTFEKVFPTLFNEDFDKSDIELPFCIRSVGASSSIKIAKPKVFIPIFPGTNSEYDTAHAFTKAGGEVESFVIKNLDRDMLNYSVEEIVKQIKSSQIIAFSGGFSAGDEPEGSGKFIAVVFKNEYIKEAVMDLINNRDGLVIGICNGFQALIKLGLLPYGEIRDIDENSPTLTFNKIGRHISTLASTKIISNVSPWFNNVNVGDIHKMPVSHGEGRFVANEDVIRNLAENGQIATQYVDLDGIPTYDTMFNPNGSMYAIEGITSPDGRVLGKMGHSERIGNGVYKNILGNNDQKLFESGIKYFS